jgi:hypothetical protein
VSVLDDDNQATLITADDISTKIVELAAQIDAD